MLCAVLSSHIYTRYLTTAHTHTHTHKKRFINRCSIHFAVAVIFLFDTLYKTKLDMIYKLNAWIEQNTWHSFEANYSPWHIHSTSSQRAYSTIFAHSNALHTHTKLDMIHTRATLDCHANELRENDLWYRDIHIHIHMHKHKQSYECVSKYSSVCYCCRRRCRHRLLNVPWTKEYYNFHNIK